MAIYNIWEERKEISGFLPPKKLLESSSYLEKEPRAVQGIPQAPEFWCSIPLPALILARGYANPSVPYTLNLHEPISKQAQLFKGEKNHPNNNNIN